MPRDILIKTACGDVDECLDEAVCQNGSKCENNIGSYKCVCDNGYPSINGFCSSPIEFEMYQTALITYRYELQNFEQKNPCFSFDSFFDIAERENKLVSWHIYVGDCITQGFNR